jgi:hypothetical protein
MRLAILIGVLFGALVYLLRSRRKGGTHRPLREVLPEMCLAAVIGGIFSFALEHPLPPLFPPASTSPPPLSSAFPTATAVVGHGVRIWADTCSEVGNETTCEVKISPVGGQVAVEVPCGEIRIWDDGGNLYTPALVTLGNETRASDGVVGALLAEGLATTLEFTFVGLDREARRLPRVEVPIRYADGRVERLPISFGDVLG